MLKTRLLHPEIQQALGEAGHGSQVLIADGNYPLLTQSNGAAHRVYLNLARGLVTVTDVLGVLVDVIPIEAALVMAPDSGSEPGIFAELRTLLPFHSAARSPDLALVFSTGEERVYAKLLLTIGVLPPE